MTVYTYNGNIPGANNDPSVDQPKMLSNYQAIGGPMSASSPTDSGIIGVDHVGFNATDGGTHKKVTYSSYPVVVAPSDPISIAYTKQGTTTLKAENVFQNSLGIFPISSIKAYARFQTSNAFPIPPNPATTPIVSGFNIISLIGISDIGAIRRYTINLTTGTMVDTKGAVFFTFSDYSAITSGQYNYTMNASSIELNFTRPAAATPTFIVTFMLLQF